MTQYGTLRAWAFIATIPIALAQAMRAIADVGDTVSAR